MGGRRRTLSLAILIVLAAGLSGVAAPALPAQADGPVWAAGSAPADRAGADGSAGMNPTGPGVPVVLVHGLTASGPAVWGDRDSDGKGLYGHLVRAGYEPGRTLLCFDYAEDPGADYRALAAVGLEGIVRQAMTAAGSTRVDIVTFGSGALVARYWVAACGGEDGPAPLRNLVMIAPPNHGQFQVDLLKILYHVDRLVDGGAAAVYPPGGRSAADLLAGPPAFAGEDAYVAARAGAYELLYGSYVLSTRLLGGSLSASSDRIPPGYEAWIAATYPDLVEELIYSAETSPVSDPFGLTRAYYELLSLRAGRQLHLARVVAATRLPSLPPLSELVSGDWRSALTGYLKQLLLEWGLARAGDLWRRERAGLGLTLGSLLTGFSVGSPALSRLVPEYLVFPADTPARTAGGLAPGRRVLCNWFLHAWREAEARARPGDSRYVTVAGSWPNLYGFAGLGVGPNDLVVETSSTLTEPHPPDVFVRRTGLFSVHRALARDLGVAGAVLATLAGPAVSRAGTLPAQSAPAEPASPAETGAGPSGAAAAAFGPASETGFGSASLWVPDYRTLPTDGPVTVEVRATDPGASGLADLQVLCWVASIEMGADGAPAAGSPPAPLVDLTLGARYAAGRTAVAPKSGETAGSDAVWGGPAVVREGVLTVGRPDPGKGLVLGVRLVPDPEAGPGHLTMTRYLERSARLPFSYSVIPGAAATGPGAVAGVDESVPGETASARTDSGSTGPGGAAAVGEDHDGASAGPAGPNEPGGEPSPVSDDRDGSGPDPDGQIPVEIVPTTEPPLINVVRVTKMTTRKREDRTYHDRWEWNFGDGETLVDDDPSNTRVTVIHTYRSEGDYTVRAVSVANDGQVLRELTWTAQAREGPTAGGMTFEFDGKPARFELKAEVSRPPHTRKQVIKAYPGWVFFVVWEKPGMFEVRGAVSVRQSYEFPERRLTIYNTYIVVVPVEVFVPGLTG